VGFPFEDFLGGSPGRCDDHFAAPSEQVAEDVLLDAAVNDHHAKAQPRFAPVAVVQVRVGGRSGLGDGHFGSGECGIVLVEVAVRAPASGLVVDDLAHQVATGKRRQLRSPRHQRLVVELAGRDDAHLPAMCAQVSGELAGVNARDADDTVVGEVATEVPIAAPVRGVLVVFADDESLDPRSPGFHILGIDAVVADLGVCHRDYLSAVRGVRQHFLIADHTGVKTYLARRFALGPEPVPVKNRAVRESEQRGPHLPDHRSPRLRLENALAYYATSEGLMQRQRRTAGNGEWGMGNDNGTARDTVVVRRSLFPIPRR
jgi:hypothetical protein